MLIVCMFLILRVPITTAADDNFYLFIYLFIHLFIYFLFIYFFFLYRKLDFMQIICQALWQDIDHLFCRI